MKKCFNCGRESPDSSHYCQYCGFTLDAGIDNSVASMGLDQKPKEVSHEKEKYIRRICTDVFTLITLVLASVNFSLLLGFALQNKGESKVFFVIPLVLGIFYFLSQILQLVQLILNIKKCKKVDSPMSLDKNFIYSHLAAGCIGTMIAAAIAFVGIPIMTNAAVGVPKYFWIIDGCFLGILVVFVIVLFILQLIHCKEYNND